MRRPPLLRRGARSPRRSFRPLARRSSQSEGGIVARQRGPRQERLDAAAPPAVARRPRPLVVRHRRQRIVSPLARDRVRAGDDAAIQHEAAARAGADDDAEDRVSAGRGAIRRFRQREAVGVVGEPYRPAEQAREILAERLAVQPRRVRVFHEAGCGRDRSRDADANRAALARVLLDVVHEAHDRGQGGVVGVPRRGNAQAHALLAAVPNGDAFDLGAAEVDADSHGAYYPAVANCGVEPVDRKNCGV